MFGKKRSGSHGHERIPMPEERTAVPGPRYTPPPPPPRKVLYTQEGRPYLEPPYPAPEQARPLTVQAREIPCAPRPSRRCPINSRPCIPNCAWYGANGCAMVGGVKELFALVEAVLRLGPPDIEPEATTEEKGSVG